MYTLLKFANHCVFQYEVLSGDSSYEWYPAWSEYALQRATAPEWSNIVPNVTSVCTDMSTMFIRYIVFRFGGH